MNTVCKFSILVSRQPQYKDVYSRTIEILQCVYILKANCCLKVHNAHLKLASPILENDRQFWDKGLDFPPSKIFTHLQVKRDSYFPAKLIATAIETD